MEVAPVRVRRDKLVTNVAKHKKMNVHTCRVVSNITITSGIYMRPISFYLPVLKAGDL
jgi:hypothetical protein